MITHRIERRPAADPMAADGAARAALGPARPVGGLSLPASPSIAETVRLAGGVARSLTIVCGAIALVVHVSFAAAARRWLAFPFAGVPARPSEAASIFSHNLRALGAVCSLLLIAQSTHWNAAGAPGPAHRMLRRFGEALLAAAVAANLFVIGASFGAYGTRMVRAAVPHGPVELAAYSLALALYLRGRGRRLPARCTVAVLALSVSTLGLAAVLETYVNI